MSSKYCDLADAHLFFQVATETAGTWNQMAAELVISCLIFSCLQALCWWAKEIIRLTSGQRNLTKSASRPPPRKNCPFHFGIVAPPNAWFSRPTRVHIPNGISIGSAVLAQLMVLCPTDTHTDSTQTHRPRNSSNSKPHLCSLCMRRGLIIVVMVFVTDKRNEQIHTQPNSKLIRRQIQRTSNQTHHTD